MYTEDNPRFKESIYCKFTSVSVGDKAKRVTVHFNTREYVDKDGTFNGGGYRVAMSALNKRIENIKKKGGIPDESMKALEAARKELKIARELIDNELGVRNEPN